MTERSELESRAGDCEVCRKSTNILNIIPQKRDDGSLITLACTECATKSGMFCTDHERPHIGFEDDTTACLSCIEEEVAQKGGEISLIFFGEITKSTKKEEIIRAMENYVETTSIITESPKIHCVARAIVTAALRSGRSTDEVISQTAQEGPAVLFPWISKESQTPN